jgi:hypothetical protein
MLGCSFLVEQSSVEVVQGFAKVVHEVEVKREG